HRHHQVEHDDVRPQPALQQVQRLEAVGRGDDLVALALEQQAHRLADVPVVLDDQHRIHGVLSSRGRSATTPRSTWATSGSSTVKADPTPSSLVTEIRPPCISTKRRAMYSPSPSPP